MGSVGSTPTQSTRVMKINDRVKINFQEIKRMTYRGIIENCFNENDVGTITDIWKVGIVVDWDRKKLNSVFHSYFPSDLIKINNSYNKPMSLFKRLVDKSIRILYKVNYLNGNLELTEKGKQELLSILFEQNKEELVKSAEKELKEEELEK